MVLIVCDDVENVLPRSQHLAQVTQLVLNRAVCLSEVGGIETQVRIFVEGEARETSRLRCTRNIFIETNILFLRDEGDLAIRAPHSQETHLLTTYLLLHSYQSSLDMSLSEAVSSPCSLNADGIPLPPVSFHAFNLLQFVSLDYFL